MDEARETAYHYIRVHLADKVRPAAIERVENGHEEPLWVVDLVARDGGNKQSELRIGADTGSIYSYQTA